MIVHCAILDDLTLLYLGPISIQLLFTDESECLGMMTKEASAHIQVQVICRATTLHKDSAESLEHEVCRPHVSSSALACSLLHAVA
jgi:hypothetical protein